MHKNKLSRKQKKIFKPFVKNDRMLERLRHYVGDRAFAANESQIQSKINKLSSTNQRKKRSAHRMRDLFYLDTKGVNYNSSCSSDSQFSDDNESDKKKPNLLNDSLISVYMNSSKTDKTVVETEMDVASNGISRTPTLLPNKSSFSTAGNSNKKLKISDKYSENAAKRIKQNEQTGSAKQWDDTTTKSDFKSTIEPPLVTFADVGGYDDVLIEMCDLLLHLKQPAVCEHFGFKYLPRGILLHGPRGCGKTLIVHATAGESGLTLIEVAPTELISGVSGESEIKIRELFERAVSCAPCILFIDNIDAVAPKRETAQREMEKRIVTQLLNCMDELNRKDTKCQVVVIGATNRVHSLDSDLREAGRFDCEISIGIPDEAARLQILNVICKKQIGLSPDFDLNWLARNTPSYLGGDLIAVVQAARKNAFRRMLQKSLQKNNLENENSKMPLSVRASWLKGETLLTEHLSQGCYIEVEDFEIALQNYVPVAKREGFASIPNMTWEDVGALKHVREDLQEAIMWPIKYQKEFKDFNLTPPTGILLCGPKGCGKTLLAKAIANECSINFLSVKGPELLNMYFGESERAVRECFQRAKNSAPCVIFFDEIDALCPARSNSNENAAADRVVNALLAEIDGIEGRKQIFVMGATNRPDNIDSAMLRPGRLEKVLFVGVPNKVDRLEILQTITKNGTKPPIVSDVNLELLASDDRCEGFSGADLACLVREASIMALKDYITSCNAENDSVNFGVKFCHFEKAFSKVKCSITDKDQHFFKRFHSRNSV